MTMPDADLLDNELEPQSPEVEVPTPETPEVTPPIQEAAPAPQPDPWAAVNRLAETMQAEVESRRQAAAQPAQPPQWVDPYDRPENASKLDELEERATWDPTARAPLREFRRQLDREAMNHELAQRENAMRAEMQAAQQVGQLETQFRASARQHGDLVTDDALDSVTSDVFQGMDAATRSRALADPTMQKLLIEAAAGRRVLAGKATPPNAPARPAAPPPVRSSNRGNTTSQGGNQNFSDPTYMEQIMQDAWNNPGNYGGKK